MAKTKRMRLVGRAKSDKDSELTKLTKNKWDNLPYPAIHMIAKFGLQISYFLNTAWVDESKRHRAQEYL